MSLFSELINQQREGRITAYQAASGDIKEHYGIEQTVLAGGYGYRQVLELVQNGADAILEAHASGATGSEKNRIDVLLENSFLYVANTGAPLSEDGIDALLHSHHSTKRGNQIGRFGLGFKSLLRLGGKIDIFSTTGALRFDPEKCRNELKKRFTVSEAPALRLAWALDTAHETETDQVLRSFSRATTVVRAEIKDQDILQHLQREIAQFPSEFLLFLPVPVTLNLDDGTKSQRMLRREPDGPDMMLHDGEKTSRWRVVEQIIKVTDDRAKNDATHIHARDEVPIAWAMPLEGGREEAGRFWAFFPTHTPTRLPGILNAPWKLNSDRNAIIPGEWNTNLMVEAARVVATTLPTLATAEDLARPLDAFPRQLERQDEDAAPLVNQLWSEIETSHSVPNASGKFCAPNGLWRHPQVDSEIATRWAAAAQVAGLERLVHPSCLKRDRDSRLSELNRRFEKRIVAGTLVESCLPILKKTDAASWFESVASLESIRALEALRIAEDYANNCTPGQWSTARPLLSIIPSDDGRLLNAQQVILAPEAITVPGRAGVAPALRQDLEGNRLLTEVMKVRQLDDAIWRNLIEEALSVIESEARAPNYISARSADSGWRIFWARLRSASEIVRTPFIEQNKPRIRIRRGDGAWVFADEVLFQGVLINSETDLEQNRKLLPDAVEHGNDEDILRQIGVTDSPTGHRGPSNYGWIVGENRHLLRGWLNERRDSYLESIESRQKPNRDYLEPRQLCMPRGWMHLVLLAGRANGRFAQEMLNSIQREEFSKPIVFGHTTRGDTYPNVAAPHPLPWLLLRHGSILIGNNQVSLLAVAAHRLEPAMLLLPTWCKLQASIEKLAVTEMPIASPPLASNAMWSAMIDFLVTPEALGGDTLFDLWAGAARDGFIPDKLRSANGDVPLSEVYVTESADLASRARASGRLVVTLEDHALQLWLTAGGKNLHEFFKPEWNGTISPPALVLSTMPELAAVMREEIKETARCQNVAGLMLRLDDASESLPCLMWENVLLLDADHLAKFSRAQRLRKIVNESAAAGWLEKEPNEALRLLCDAEVEERRRKVAGCSTLPAKLLLAVGNHVAALRVALGELSKKNFMMGCTPIEMSELVLASLGPTTLSSLRDALTEEGLNPPARWNGAEGRAFVESIGFPLEFAVSPESRREAEESISGPIHLPPLHDFQVEVADGLKEIMSRGTGRRRAVVSLPTGGGKTRVVVQTAVESVLRPEGGNRTLLWVAQTDELCEQAVQSFRQVWINCGAAATDLRIIRFWGGHPNPVPPAEGVPVVVVASIQTLNARVWSNGLSWLSKPGIVVIDECHHAITKSYTNLLRWLDAEAARPGAPETDEPPIIGLSATPFRSTDEVETRRLARRFDNTWLPNDQEGLYERLRVQGVLAEAQYEALKSPAQLLDSEAERLSKFGDDWEGLDFEALLEEINQRLAVHEVRNRILLNRIEASTECSILFFSNSVSHAEEMAARLHLRGIRAAAVSNKTPAAARRSFLESFQRGETRVLCNHSVLTTGFDAPKTDLVLIARQVLSPVRYMQMIGRGLRGEKNGGTKTCRIVTVVDNLGRFANKLPYHFCEKYFSASTHEVTPVVVEVQTPASSTWVDFGW